MNEPRQLAVYGELPPPFGGVTVHVRRLTARLQGAGITCRVYNPATESHGKVLTGVTQIRKNWRGFLRFLCTVPEPVVHLHTNNFSALTSAAWVLKRRGKKVLATIHNQYMLRMCQESVLRYWQQQAGLSRIDQFIAVSGKIEGQLRELGVPESRTTVAPAFLPPGPEELCESLLPDDLRRFLDSHSPIVATQGFFGNFIDGQHVYAFELIAELAERLRNRWPRVGVYTAVSGTRDAAHRSRILRLRRELKLDQDWVLWERAFPAVAMFRRCNLFVRPTTTDGDSVSVRECLSMGIPVVASDSVTRPAGCTLFRNLDINSLETAVYKAMSLSTKSLPVEKDNLSPVLEAYGRCGIPVTRAVAA
jgi:glycosyltransferase involved in cell wall biosynthesis